MAVCSAGDRLAREIYDELLVCKICHESYKTPKCLSCLHTFCEACIEDKMVNEFPYKRYTDYRRFACPLCHRTTQLSAGGVHRLTDNFLVTSLADLVRRQRSLQRFPSCDLCGSLGGGRRHREAQSKCLDCDKTLCPPCVARHRATRVTRDHSLFDVEIEKDVECREHEGEPVRFYCNACDLCVCVLCTFQDHRDHDVASFKDAVERHREDMLGMLSRCREKIGELELQVDSLLRCQQFVKNIEQQIGDAAIEYIREVRKKEHQLIEELHAIYGPECLEFIEKRKEISSELENLRSTCSVTEMVVNGKDIALLLLKKEVQEKLKALSMAETRPMPSTINKTVKFKSSAFIEIGSIQDQDKLASSRTTSLPKKSRLHKKEAEKVLGCVTSLPSPEISRRTKGTQTESKATNDIAIQTEARRQFVGKKEPSQYSKPAKYY